jgi:hypothetical protein
MTRPRWAVLLTADRLASHRFRNPSRDRGGDLRKTRRHYGLYRLDRPSRCNVSRSRLDCRQARNNRHHASWRQCFSRLYSLRSLLRDWAWLAKPGKLLQVPQFSVKKKLGRGFWLPRLRATGRGIDGASQANNAQTTKSAGQRRL